MCSFKGVIPPIVMPVTEREHVDPAGLRRVIDYVIDGGVHGIFVNGSNGEFYGLDYDNQKIAAETAIDHSNGRVPVCVGASSITTRDSIRLAKMAGSAGADFLTILTPMFIQPDEDELFEHFRAITESCELSVILYNNPSRTTNQISSSLLKRLLELDRIIGIKNTSMDFSLTMKYIEVGKAKPSFTVFGGIDYYIYATLLHGGGGCVAGTANVVPGLVVDIYECFVEGDYTGALEAQQRLIPLRDSCNLGSFPVMMKVFLNLLGMDVGRPIKPIGYVDDLVVEEAKGILRNLGMLDRKQNQHRRGKGG